MPNPGHAIFISYRRSDSSGEVGRLRDRLAIRWGASAVFLDAEDVEAGTPFPEAIRQALSTSSVLIAIIGPEWCTVADSHGMPRLQAKDDWVREELAYAFRHQIPVIPVLVSGAKFPDKGRLPIEIAWLGEVQAIELSQARFDADVRRLVDAIERRVLARFNDPRTRLLIFALRTKRRLVAIGVPLLMGVVLTWIILSVVAMGD